MIYYTFLASLFTNFRALRVNNAWNTLKWVKTPHFIGDFASFLLIHGLFRAFFVCNISKFVFRNRLYNGACFYYSLVRVFGYICVKHPKIRKHSNPKKLWSSINLVTICELKKECILLIEACFSDFTQTKLQFSK